MNCCPSFIVVVALSTLMGYLAIVDPSIRTAFTQLVNTALTGHFALTIPQKRKEDDAPK